MEKRPVLGVSTQTSDQENMCNPESVIDVSFTQVLPIPTGRFNAPDCLYGGSISGIMCKKAYTFTHFSKIRYFLGISAKQGIFHRVIKR
jgi:hypothetical protein